MAIVSVKTRLGSLRLTNSPGAVGVASHSAVSALLKHLRVACRLTVVDEVPLVVDEVPLVVVPEFDVTVVAVPKASHEILQLRAEWRGAARRESNLKVAQVLFHVQR